jgi:hypothetical protein
MVFAAGTVTTRFEGGLWVMLPAFVAVVTELKADVPLALAEATQK